MDIFLQLWHSGVRETRRHCTTITGAAHQGGGAFKTRPLVSSCGPYGSVLFEFGGPLDAIFPAQGQGWLETSPHAWTSAGNETAPAERVDRSVKGRSAGRRLRHRNVDRPPRGRANPPALGHRVSSGACMESAGGVGLELPETRTAGPATQREKNPAVEADPMAAYKKKPARCGRIWSSWMRAGFCLFRRCSAPGRQGAGLPSCGTVTDGIACRSSED